MTHTFRELFNFGGIPYFGMTNKEASEKVLLGFRLPQPEGCPDELYLLMEIDMLDRNIS